MQVTARRLRDRWFENFFTEVDPKWDYEDFLTDAGAAYRHDWISFDGVLADDERGVVWCGVSTFSGDIFWAYERATGKFRSLNFQRVGDRFDAKFHRAMERDGDGMIWAATAMLHDCVQYNDAPGGAIVRFDPRTEKLDVVARPFPHIYIQSLILDPRRRILYGQTYLHEYLFRFDIDSGQARILTHLGHNIYTSGLTQAENIAVAPDGTLWGAWSPDRAWGHSAGQQPYRIFRYHPDEDRVHFLRRGFPANDGIPGFARMDSFIVAANGSVFVSSVDGCLGRLDGNGAIEVIGRPGRGKLQRLSAMANGPDGRLYGVAGKGGLAELFSLDPTKGTITTHGPLVEPSTGVTAWQIHDLTVTVDGVIYAGENDVPHRSSYLWEITGVCR